ncbi:MAG: adenine phosphoribosyltransferase [Anaerolineae bacterium]
MDLASLIRDIPDFPIKGILFKDITTLMKDGAALRQAVDALAAPFRDSRVDLVAAIESRGFIFAAPVAYQLGAGFVPIRKPGKLPAETVRVEYTLEYGANTLELHRDAIRPGQRVLLIDDLLATGGSARAAVQLIEQLGGQVIGIAFLVNLTFLKGADKLAGYNVFSVIDY